MDPFLNRREASIVPPQPGKWYVSRTSGASPVRRVGPYATQREAADVAYLIEMESLQKLRCLVWQCPATQEPLEGGPP